MLLLGLRQGRRLERVLGGAERAAALDAALLGLLLGTGRGDVGRRQALVGVGDRVRGHRLDLGLLGQREWHGHDRGHEQQRDGPELALDEPAPGVGDQVHRASASVEPSPAEAVVVVVVVVVVDVAVEGVAPAAPGSVASGTMWALAPTLACMPGQPSSAGANVRLSTRISRPLTLIASPLRDTKRSSRAKKSASDANVPVKPKL